MKIVRYIFFGLIALGLIFGAIGGISAAVHQSQEESYHPTMEGLDLKTADGSLIAGYNLEQSKYTRKYIPTELLAEKPEEVGYLVQMDFTSTGAMYTGGHYVRGDIVDLQLVDCDTGEVLAETTFEPYFPMSVSSETRTVSVNAEAVSQWINHVYPQWPEDKDVGHEWTEATCTEAKVCKICGIAEGGALGHDFGGGLCGGAETCLRCGEENTSQGGHQMEGWSLDTNNFFVMTGQCSNCSIYQKTKTDWSFFVDELPLGTWELVDILKDDTFTSHTNSTPEVTFQINQDKTAVMYTSKGEYHFTWEFDDVSLSENYPDMLTVYYDAYDDEGVQYTLAYDYFNNRASVAFYAEEESLFFE